MGSEAGRTTSRQGRPVPFRGKRLPDGCLQPPTQGPAALDSPTPPAENTRDGPDEGSSAQPHPLPRLCHDDSLLSPGGPGSFTANVIFLKRKPKCALLLRTLPGFPSRSEAHPPLPRPGPCPPPRVPSPPLAWPGSPPGSHQAPCPASRLRPTAPPSSSGDPRWRQPSHGSHIHAHVPVGVYLRVCAPLSVCLSLSTRWFHVRPLPSPWPVKTWSSRLRPARTLTPGCLPPALCSLRACWSHERMDSVTEGASRERRW
ncbi:uncharacterized protein LOC130849071 [Hippopotamus amphibius kiboko]|uniref:uncharacterized protein LOC130849071 n=1 Tax=Hippopotamus amphibius kiboko TaxID=575201 RepID=UPI0025930351|nr:uncharacterized protein LOC130849071 [Hippopotamus amphibius kiboko]